MNTIKNIKIAFDGNFIAVVTKSDNIYDIDWVRDHVKVESLSLKKEEFLNWLNMVLDQWK